MLDFQMIQDNTLSQVLESCFTNGRHKHPENMSCSEKHVGEHQIKEYVVQECCSLHITSSSTENINTLGLNTRFKLDRTLTYHYRHKLTKNTHYTLSYIVNKVSSSMYFQVKINVKMHSI